MLPLRLAPPLAAAAVVGAEVEYLSAQLWQLPIMQHALEESEASSIPLTRPLSCLLPVAVVQEARGKLKELYGQVRALDLENAGGLTGEVPAGLPAL